MDRLVQTLVGLGIPGLVLLIAISVSGYAGGAAIASALATLGGPLGMLGGIALLCLLAMISSGISKYGFEAIFSSVTMGLKQKGVSDEEIREKISSYPITKGMKRKIIQKFDDSIAETGTD